ncbi:cytochrome d ubiquinol oxidase subunit II, partial [Nocardiopsis coralliicola]
METLPILALALLAGGYAVLAGCDVGLGMLLPQLARTPAERRRLVAAAAPYFLGTEVWLVAAIGLAAGAFPDLKAAVAGPLWPVFTALAAAWIVRDAGLWLHARSAGRTWRAACEAAITAGSWVLAACWGAAVAGLLTGSAPTSPFAIACAALVVVLVLLRGAAFGAERLAGAGAPESGAGADSAARLTRWPARAGLLALALAAAAALLPGGPDAE